ncbi:MULTISPECIES: hypothetical protein [Geodermatophilus]|uniref:Uncharacterized protein n=1 Tax=Geodermatophilus nigrescens TaxID=1070870 RepID=A0A1M5R4R5_9ACTN|nr:hypothetical protein [Geodermatophilus nigrescens]SHH20763.1 hypothetical protein SAMN05444351_4289 [Geodermatophilus nigrescens]
MTDHTLATMEELDPARGGGGPGDHVAVCACGWRSDAEPDRDSALERLTEHAEEND